MKRSVMKSASSIVLLFILLFVSSSVLAVPIPVSDPNGPYSGDVGNPVQFDGSVLTLAWATDESGPEGQLNAVRLNLEVLDRKIARILAEPPLPGAPGPKINAIVNKLESADHKILVLERRMGDALDATVDGHLAAPEDSLDWELVALTAVQEAAAGIRQQVGKFLELTPPDTIPPAFRDALTTLRASASGLVQKADLDFYAVEYKRNIPIRFVQFFTTLEQILTDSQLQDVIEVTNRVFLPARLRFHLWRNEFLYSPVFAHLTEEVNGERQDLMYEWPDDITTSPLLKRLHSPDPFSCEFEFVRPEDDEETRLAAQMRAGTYCAPVGEILVYVNQGYSNGGQYPWYSRIIGMTRHHVLWYVFQHEVGHYLGLPHTFPYHRIFSPDYSFGRMVGTDQNPDLDVSTILRRYYRPFKHLLNPETDDWAVYGDFWDLVFEPRVDGQHRFFDSREEAAQAFFVQPIEQLQSGVLCRPYDPDCAVSSPVTTLKMTVASGCLGQPRDFSDCEYPPVNFYTGDPEVRGFSRFGSAPDKIHLNVMAYYYPFADGTEPSPLPSGEVEGVFITQSQVEQIDRVMTYDIPTWFTSAAGPIDGLRPELNLCSKCH